MATVTPRSWLIVVIGGRTVWSCARTLRKLLPFKHISFIGIRPGPTGKKRAVAKPFAQSTQRNTVTGKLPEWLLKKLIETARSARDENSLIHEFGNSFSITGLDIVVLMDSNDPVSASVYKDLIKKMSEQRVLHHTLAVGLRLLVFIPGQGKPLSNRVADVFQECECERDILLDHSIVIQPENIDGLTINLSALACLVGNSIGTILQLEPNHPVRLFLRPNVNDMNHRMKFWSLGYSAMSFEGKHLINHIYRCYLRLLSKTFKQRNLSSGQATASACNTICLLIDSEIPDSELPQYIAKWAKTFFRVQICESNSRLPTPADLLVCLEEMVKELTTRSKEIDANLPNRPFKSVIPRDPRGWFKKLLNWLTLNRVFCWKCCYDPPTNIVAQATIRRNRLATLDLPIMNLQLAVRRSFQTLEHYQKQILPDLKEENTRTEKWWEPVVRKKHTEIVNTICNEALGLALISGEDPIRHFKIGLLKQLEIPLQSQGLELATAIDSLTQANGTWLKQTIRTLGDQAAPWWSEPLEAGIEEQIFAFLPQKDYQRIADVVDAGVTAVTWQREALGVLRFLWDCEPEALRTRLDQTQMQTTAPRRNWVTETSVQHRKATTDPSSLILNPKVEKE